MTRTYGTYAYIPTGDRWTAGKPTWSLTLEPAVAVRAKRIFARARSTTAGAVMMLAHRRDRPRPHLAQGAVAARTRRRPQRDDARVRLRSSRRAERTIAEVLAGRATLAPLTVAPAKEPRDYQRTAVELLRASGRLLLTDDLGLGKTFHRAPVPRPRRRAAGAVVVPPTHLPSRWVTELQEAFRRSASRSRRRRRRPPRSSQATAPTC